MAQRCVLYLYQFNIEFITIISEKPKRKESEGARVFLPACVSGIISSTITKSMLPPASESKNGKTTLDTLANK